MSDLTSDDVKLLLRRDALERDALNRIRWDSRLSTDSFEIAYYDRISGRLTVIPYTEIEVEGDFLRHGDSMIPLHRIREIRYCGEVVWAKRSSQ